MSESKLMPVELTPEMESAALAAMWDTVPVWDARDAPHPNDIGRPNLAWCEPDRMLKAAWQALLAAAPPK